MPHSLAAQRLEGITVWRAMLMLGGLLVHASIGSEDHPGLNLITGTSAMFRIGCFFLISGLLCGAALIRRSDPGHWLRHRLLQIGMPTLFGLAVICPLTGAVLGPGGPGFITYHLWFLVALIAYLLVGYAGHRVLGVDWAMVDRLDARRGGGRGAQALLIGATAVASFNLMIAGLGWTAQCVPDRLLAMFAQAWLAAGYAPMFLLGVLLARAPALRRDFCAGWMLPATILAAVAVTRLLPLPAALASIDPLLRVGGMAAAPPAAAALMLRSALTIRRAPVPLARLSEASFTMYLVHYPLMVAIKAVLAPLGWGPWPLFAAALIGGGGLSYLIWAMAVRRSAILSLLLAGRIPQGRSPRGALRTAA